MALEETHLELSNPTSLTRIASPDDYAICHQIMLKASNNYSFASKFLPSEKRHHVDALYAFLRIGDDRVDVSYEGFASPLQAIEAWEKAYWQAFDHGESKDPVIRAYLNTAVENGIPASTMTPYFRAMKDDLIKTRFATFDELLHYMDGSAVPVGRAMTYILGVREPHTYSEALERADYLSIGMQMSNFWRDIGQDWGIGRVYLPQEDMELFGVREKDLVAGRINDPLIELLEFEIGRTEHYYSLARSGIPMLASGQWGVMSSMLIYQAILNSIRENKYDVFSRRARTNGLEKAKLMFTAWNQVRINSHDLSS